MPDRILLESSTVDGILLENGSDVLLLDAPPTPTIRLVDNFNRANESPVSDGSKWTPGGLGGETTGPKIVSNQIVRQLASGSFGRDGVYRNDITFPAGIGCEVGATIVQMTADGELDITLFNGTTTGYEVLIMSSVWAAGPQVQLNRSVAGVTKILGTSATVPASGDKYALQIYLDNVSVWLFRSSAWSQIISVMDITNRGAMIPAFSIAGQNDTTAYIIDDFGANTIPVNHAISALGAGV